MKDEKDVRRELGSAGRWSLTAAANDGPGRDRQQRLVERDPSPLVLAPTTPDGPELPGVAEWRAEQKRKAAADLLRRELATFNPSNPRDPAGPH